MKIEEKTNYDFTLEFEEKDLLIKSMNIINSVTKAMEERKCDTLVSGYPDCEYYTTTNELAEAYYILSNLCKAWEIRGKDGN